jgi:DNA polymerase III subunit delta'
VRDVDPTEIPMPRTNPYFMGHDAAEKDYLGAWSSGRLAHAWLICGPRGIGKATLAHRMARFALLQGGEDDEVDIFGGPPSPKSLQMSADHPVFKRLAAGGHSDFRIIERLWADTKKTKRKTVIGVDEVREIGAFMSMTSAEGGWRTVIIDAVDEMNANAENAVLKILEEPPRRALLLLVAHNPDSLLPTIRSRCRRLDLHTLTQTQVKNLMGRYRPDIKDSDVTVLSVLADGSIGRAMELSDEGGVALFRELMALLGDVPRLNITKLHALSDKAIKGDAFRTLSSLLSWWLARIATEGARGKLEMLAEIVPGERELARKLLSSAPPPAWAEVWNKNGHLARRTDAVNLDKKRSIMLMLMAVESTAALGKAA